MSISLCALGFRLSRMIFGRLLDLILQKSFPKRFGEKGCRIVKRVYQRWFYSLSKTHRHLDDQTGREDLFS